MLGFLSAENLDRVAEGRVEFRMELSTYLKFKDVEEAIKFLCLRARFLRGSRDPEIRLQ
jgi:hypothetical protein